MRDRLMLGVSVLGFFSLCWLCLARNGGLLAAAASPDAGPLSSLSVKWNGPQVTITGLVPDSAVKAQVQARVESLSRAQTIENAIETGETAAPGDWLGPVLESISAARPRLDLGELKVVNRSMTLTGEVADTKERDDVLAALRDAAGRSFSVTSGLEVSAKTAARRHALALRDRLAAQSLSFSRGSVTLDESTQSLVREVAAAMTADEGIRLLVQPPTAAGGGRRGQSLGDNRARAVRAQLIGLGVPGDRVDVGGAGAGSDGAAAAPGPRGIELIAKVGEDAR